MRKEWKILLENTLASTDFETWKKKKRNRHKLSEGEQIRQYLYKEKSLSDERRKEILDMVSFVYFEEDNNVPCLKLEYYLTNGNNYIGAVNLFNGGATNCDDNEYVRYYKESVLDIEV